MVSATRAILLVQPGVMLDLVLRCIFSLQPPLPPPVVVVRLVDRGANGLDWFFVGEPESSPVQCRSGEAAAAAVLPGAGGRPSTFLADCMPDSFENRNSVNALQIRLRM